MRTTESKRTACGTRAIIVCLYMFSAIAAVNVLLIVADYLAGLFL